MLYSIRRVPLSKTICIYFNIISFKVTFHRTKILELINQANTNTTIDCLNSNIEEYIHIASGKGKKGKNKGKKEKKSKKKPGETQLQFPAELFISGR